jgi:hypothetical protein
MRVQFSFIVVLVFSLFLSACGDNLDRNAASKLIREQYPTVITKSFELHQAAFGVNSSLDIRSGHIDFNKRDKEVIAKLEEKLESMKRAGFITYNKERKTNQFFSLMLGNMIYKITPTDKMSELIHKRPESRLDSSVEVIVGQVEFDKVTGIMDINDSAKKIEYLTKPIFNELSKFFMITDSERNPVNKTAYFQKYDDGWRLVKTEFGMGSFSGNQQSSRQSVNVSNKVEEPANSISENSGANVPAASDNNKQVTLDKKYVGTYLSDHYDFIIELAGSNAVFYSMLPGFLGEMLTNIESTADNEFQVRITDVPNIDIQTIKIETGTSSLLVPSLVLKYMVSHNRDMIRAGYPDYVSNASLMLNGYTISKDDIHFSKIKTFPKDMLEGKWFNIRSEDIGEKSFLMLSEVLEISKNGMNAEIVVLDKDANTIKEYVPDDIEFRHGSLLQYKVNRDGKQKELSRRRVTDIQPEKLTMEFIESGFGTVKRFELVFVPYTGQPHINKSDKNASELPELNSNQKGIVRDLLLAYKYDLNAINLVADNADYALLASAAYVDDQTWAAYKDDPKRVEKDKRNLLNLVVQRGWTFNEPAKVVENHLVGDTVARLFTNGDGKAVLAFRGSTPILGDWVTNLVSTFFRGQLEGAEQIARQVVKEFPDVIFVGHSLGGRLAQIGRYVTGNEAVIFNTAPLGLSEFSKIMSANINKPKGGLFGFRGPQDPLGAVDPASDYRDVIVENIYRAESLPTKGKLSEIYVQAWEQRSYFHGAEVLANAMQVVRSAREQEWIDAYLY